MNGVYFWKFFVIFGSFIDFFVNVIGYFLFKLEWMFILIINKIILRLFMEINMFLNKLIILYELKEILMKEDEFGIYIFYVINNYGNFIFYFYVIKEVLKEGKILCFII